MGPADWEVVLRVPGDGISALASTPDGALFVATYYSIYRGFPTRGTLDVVKVADDSGGCCQRIAASSSRELYGLSDGGALRVWRENQGVRRLAMPSKPSWMTCGSDCILAGIPLYAIWALAPGDVYVAGDFGTIVRVTGDATALEPNPLQEYIRANVGTLDAERGTLFAIGGDASRVYAASWHAQLRKERDRWETIPHPVPEAADCLVDAIAVQGRAVLYGGHAGFPRAELPCLVRVEGDLVTRLDGELRGFGQPGIFRGEAQPDGSALFYASAYGRSEVAEVRDTRVRVYAFPALRWFGGAALLGDYLYAGGLLGDTAVVVRVRRR